MRKLLFTLSLLISISSYGQISDYKIGVHDSITTKTQSNSITPGIVGRAYERLADIVGEKLDSISRSNDTVWMWEEGVKYFAFKDSVNAAGTWGAITGTLTDQTDLNTALGLKAPLASPAFTGTPTAPTQSPSNNSTRLANTAYADAQAALSVAQTITNGVTTSSPSQDAVFDALALKANIASPTFTGTVSGITKTMVGLGNVDNTSDATKDAATATLTNKTISGASNTINNLNASNLASGTVPTARLGTGTANSTTYLRGDQTWATVAGGSVDPEEIEQMIADSSYRGKDEMAFMYGVLAPDSIPVALNSPMTWSFLISDSHHTYNFCIDSITASGSSLLVHYPLPCRINDIMYGVAGLDDAISGYGMTLGTGVGERWMAIAATAKIEIGGYYYFDSPNTITLGNGLKKNLNFAYDTATAVLTVSNLATNNELLKEAWNLDVWYEGDHHYMFRQMRNSLPGSELTTLKWTLVDVVTGTPMTGARASSDVFRFRGNDVPVLVNLNLYDETTRDLIYYNSNIWVMVVGTKATHD